MRGRLGAARGCSVLALAHTVHTACMQRQRTLDAPLWSLAPLALLGVYFAAYLLSSEVFHGRLGSTPYRIRLFHSVWHQRLFGLLLRGEQQLRPAEPEFSGQVRGG